MTDSGTLNSCSTLPMGPYTTKHPCNLPAQSESASSTDPHVLPLFSQVSNKFLLWPKSVSFFLDKYQLSECFLIWNCSHQDRPLLRMRWGQPEPTIAVEPSTAHWWPWWTTHCWPRESHHLYSDFNEGLDGKKAWRSLGKAALKKWIQHQPLT